MKALVFEGKVVQVEENEFPVHKNLIWIDCDSEVKAGWLYNDDLFSAPAEIDWPWDAKRRTAYGTIGDQLDQQFHDLVNGTKTWKDHIAKVKSDFPKPE